MAADSVREAIDAVRARLRAEVDAQFATLAERQASDLAAVRAAAAAELDQRVAAARAAAEAEAERRFAAAKAAFDADAERRVTAAKAAAEADAERRFAALKASADADAERRLSAAKAAAEAEAERRLATTRPAGASTNTLLQMFRDLDTADSISSILGAIERVAGSVSSKVSLYVGPASAPVRWPAAGSPLGLDSPVAAVLRTGQNARVDGTLIVPLVLDGTAVAALEVDVRGGQASGETIEAIARYGASRLGYVTALRAGQAGRPIARRAAGPAADAAEDPVQSARRFARLLVSEIMLYHEAAVREGRQHRDLGRRLSAEIERARRAYEERVSSTVPDRHRHFHQELVQTLAGGDPALLG
jgi:hypothetical protein